jgi:predicted DNA-binding protein (MmcQ/YjbR family)
MGQPDEDRRRHLARASSLALDPAEYADVPAAVVAEVRSVCLGLPESVEKQAWAGTQWRVRNRMYAHVLTVDFVDGPVTVMTFRSSGPELDVLRSAGHPFFRPAWGAKLVGMVLDAEVNWDEVTELVIESYCVLAPRKLVERIDRPHRPHD